MSYNPYDNVLATVENAAHILGYKLVEGARLEIV